MTDRTIDRMPTRVMRLAELGMVMVLLGILTPWVTALVICGVALFLAAEVVLIGSLLRQ
jgi:hypothetical protein